MLENISQKKMMNTICAEQLYNFPQFRQKEKKFIDVNTLCLNFLFIIFFYLLLKFVDINFKKNYWFEPFFLHIIHNVYYVKKKYLGCWILYLYYLIDINLFLSTLWLAFNSFMLIFSHMLEFNSTNNKLKKVGRCDSFQ